MTGKYSSLMLTTVSKEEYLTGKEVVGLELLKDRVAIYCLRTGDTRERIAKQLGMSAVTLRSKLNGETEFRLSEAEELAKILGCSIDELKKEFTCC